ncbi:MAG: M16 family metallopeptidase, partial [Bacteroidota bacterium]
AQTAERIDTVYDNIQLPAIVHSFKMPAQGTPDFYPMSMLTSLLSQGASSRFQKSIADRQQKAVAVGAFPLGMVDHGVAIMYGIVNMGVSADSLNLAMKEEYRQIREETVQQSELNKLLTQLESDRVAQLGTVQGIAEQLSDYELFYGDANLINTEFERFRKVTPEDIRRVANTYLVPSNQVTLYYMPKPKP